MRLLPALAARACDGGRTGPSATVETTIENPSGERYSSRTLCGQVHVMNRSGFESFRLSLACAVAISLGGLATACSCHRGLPANRVDAGSLGGNTLPASGGAGDGGDAGPVGSGGTLAPDASLA